MDTEHHYHSSGAPLIATVLIIAVLFIIALMFFLPVRSVVPTEDKNSIEGSFEVDLPDTSQPSEQPQQ